MRLIHHQAGGTTIPVHLLGFDRARFAFDQFTQAGIACPAGIAGSVPKRQAEYFFGRLAARAALAHAGWPAVQLGTGARRQPLWPDGAIGAITHNNTRAAACVMRAGPLRGVGIDIETLLDADAVASVEKEVVSAAELRMLRTLHPQPAWPYAMLLTAVFSAKESFYKALSPTLGRYFGFDAIQIDAVDTAAGSLRFTSRQPLCPEWPAGRQGRIDFSLLDAETVLTAFAF